MMNQAKLIKFIDWRIKFYEVGVLHIIDLVCDEKSEPFTFVKMYGNTLVHDISQIKLNKNEFFRMFKKDLSTNLQF